MKSRQNTVCLVSSCGGHLTELYELSRCFSHLDYFFVLNDRISVPFGLEDKYLFITHSERDWKLLLNLWEALRILWVRKPKIILSTGAGPAVPFGLLGRFIFGSKVIYLETLASISRPSLTGRIMYYIANDFYYQWSDLKAYFPKGKYRGSIL